MDITTLDFWGVIGLAVLCGGVIGLERQLRGKASGIRTSIFICLGTSLFVALGVAHSNEHSDNVRVLGQVVTGIGFLGAGVMIAREGAVVGVTSAAVIWVLAAIGALIGFEHYEEATVVAFLTVALLRGIGLLEARLSALRRGVHAQTSNNDKPDH